MLLLGIASAQNYPRTITLDFLLVAGGAGATTALNQRGPGGGGAGGFRYFTSETVTGTTFSVTVGAGGAGSSDPFILGSSGNNSSFGATSSRSRRSQQH